MYFVTGSSSYFTNKSPFGQTLGARNFQIFGNNLFYSDPVTRAIWNCFKLFYFYFYYYLYKSYFSKCFVCLDRLLLSKALIPVLRPEDSTRVNSLEVTENQYIPINTTSPTLSLKRTPCSLLRWREWVSDDDGGGGGIWESRASRRNGGGAVRVQERLVHRK